MIQFSKLKDICEGTFVQFHHDEDILSLLTDSRKAFGGKGAVFFAIDGQHHDGHQYVESLYATGVRSFVVEKKLNTFQSLPEANFFLCKSSVEALQKIVAYAREQFKKDVIGITGSNGKTIIKEWLFQLLNDKFKIAKNPGSYNSQLGVPLSVWQLQDHHDLGIFEAGISQPGEMEKLEKVIQPTIGLFTNIGPAHDEGFVNQHQKIEEKAKLFAYSRVVIYCRDHHPIHESLQKLKGKTLTWGYDANADIQIKKQNEKFKIDYKDESFSLELPFQDSASIENCLHCIAVMLVLNIASAEITEKIKNLKSVPMRLELKEGINQCQIIDDTYNNDLGGLQISLQFLANQHQKKNKTVILSDVLQSGLNEKELINRIVSLIKENNITRFIGIGEKLSANTKAFGTKALGFPSTDDFLKNFDFNSLHNEIILVKGARVFQFEKIVNMLQRKVHGTIMEIDLGAVVHNLNFFRAKLKPTTKIMVMVKAFAYGSGSAEIANILQYHKVDYLGVAYADEGVDLRKNNITLPIMVMNPSEESFDSLLKYNLEPEIYNFRILEAFLKFLNGRKCNIHVKIDTGMHRLGFEKEDLELLIKTLKQNPHVRVASIFSHLAGADEAVHDVFSSNQANGFLHLADEISNSLGYKPLYHLLNSPGILRLPQFQFDMVRLGIGLYGVDPTEDRNSNLKVVATLKTVISQIKKVKKGETVGYGRRGEAAQDKTIATIAIGYADGFSRAFSRGNGEVLINGKLAKVIGNVCMDMTMVDITGIEAREGDEVIVFGAQLPIYKVAEKINTIAYEILTNTSERVKRVFVAESL